MSEHAGRQDYSDQKSSTQVPPRRRRSRIHPCLEARSRRHQKFETGVLVAPQKRADVLQFFLKKEGQRQHSSQVQEKTPNIC